MTHHAWHDRERETWPIERAERYDAGWEIDFNQRMTVVISDERNPAAIVPQTGDLYTQWGAFGLPYRGQAINGTVVFYRTQEEEDAYRAAERQTARKAAAERPPLTADEKAAIRASNMDYLNLNDAQYDEHRRLMGMKMNEWPDGLWDYVKEVGNRYGICGEVISSSVADWVRGTPEHTKMQPPDR